MHRDRFTSRKTLSPYACNDDDDGPSYLRHCRAGRCNPNRSTTQRNTMASQWKSCWKRALPVQYQVRNTPFTIMENNNSPLVRDHRYLSSLSIGLPMYNHVNYCNRTQLNTSCRQHDSTNTKSLSLLISYIHVYIYHVYLPPRTLLLQYGQAQTHKVVCLSSFPSWRPKGLLAFDLSLKTPSAQIERESVIVWSDLVESFIFQLVQVANL